MPESETIQEEKRPMEYFLNGFFLRLIYGLAAMGVMALIRPDLVTERYEATLFCLSAYMVVCILGGLYDMSSRKYHRIEGYPRFRKRDLFFLAFGVFLLIQWWMK